MSVSLVVAARDAALQNDCKSAYRQLATASASTGAVAERTERINAPFRAVYDFASLP